MGEMVERVADAIQARAIELADLAELGEFPRGAGLRELARIAIEAMRVPTEAMQRASFRATISGDGEWEAMIDAALSEK